MAQLDPGTCTAPVWYSRPRWTASTPAWNRDRASRQSSSSATRRLKVRDDILRRRLATSSVVPASNCSSTGRRCPGMTGGVAWRSS
jgi:hypothetical protein